MPKYCFDTSGFSKALQDIPMDVFENLWAFVINRIEVGDIAMTREIFDEVILIDNGFGEIVSENQETVLYEINQDGWDWGNYIEINTEILTDQHDHISEYTSGSPKTVCINDISGISLAKSLGIPMVSGESITHNLNQTMKRKIPDICGAEGVEHMTFNEFLKAEGYKG